MLRRFVGGGVVGLICGSAVGLAGVSDSSVVTGVETHAKISDVIGGFGGSLDFGDGFGKSVANIGDLDGDGVDDPAVGAPFTEHGAPFRGAVWILFLNANGSVRGEQKISDTAGGFTANLTNTAWFGSSVSGIGDLDGDGVRDLAVGAFWDDDGGPQVGALWILFLDTDGTVKGHAKISDLFGGFSGQLDDFDSFGISAACVGDLDEDGVADLAVGAVNDDDVGSGRGAVWILFLSPTGTVKVAQKINDVAGGFTGDLDDFDNFGESVAVLEAAQDGFCNLVVGAPRDDDGGAGDSDKGAVWLLSLGCDGVVIQVRGSRDPFDFFTVPKGPRISAAP